MNTMPCSKVADTAMTCTNVWHNWEKNNLGVVRGIGPQGGGVSTTYPSAYPLLPQLSHTIARRVKDGTVGLRKEVRKEKTEWESRRRISNQVVQARGYRNDSLNLEGFVI